VTARGPVVGDRQLDVDVIIFAIGFDAITGALSSIDIRGTDGRSLREAWADGPATYLGLQVAGFPNLFLITGPGSPSVLSNMVISIEQHVDLVFDTIGRMRDVGHDRIEATASAQAEWTAHVSALADETLYPRASSWYMGVNVPGKPRVFSVYIAGCGPYREVCDEVVADGYRGFELSSRESRHA
jgi:cyclohexanone monooxygenase